MRRSGPGGNRARPAPVTFHSWEAAVLHLRAALSRGQWQWPAWCFAHRACLRECGPFLRVRIRPPGCWGLYLRVHLFWLFGWFFFPAYIPPLHLLCQCAGRYRYFSLSDGFPTYFACGRNRRTPWSYAAAPRIPPRIGPTMGTQKTFAPSVRPLFLKPATAVNRRGPKSRAGLMA